MCQQKPPRILKFPYTGSKAGADAAVDDFSSEDMNKRKARVLFVCAGNSCRSQMAEGWVNYLGGAYIEARSAGLEVHEVNPYAIAAMREAGVDCSNQRSKLLTPKMMAWADLIITVCGYMDWVCPALPAGVAKRHWPLFDPSRLNGAEEDILLVHGAMRDHIQSLVEALIEEVLTGGIPARNASREIKSPV